MRKRLALLVLAFLLAAAPTSAAVTPDASATSSLVFSNTTVSWSQTCNSCDFLVIGVFASGTATTLTCDFNGTAMSVPPTNDQVLVPSDRVIYQRYLLAPASGTHTVTCVAGSSQDALAGVSQTYTGFAATGQPNGSGNTGTCSICDTISVSTTTSGFTTWGIAVAKNTNSTKSAGAGTVQRVNANDVAIYDSGGDWSAGSNALVINNDSLSNNFGVVLQAYAITGGASAPTSKRLLLLGVGQ